MYEMALCMELYNSSLYFIPLICETILMAKPLFWL